jgi:hypothetical protein
MCAPVVDDDIGNVTVGGIILGISSSTNPNPTGGGGKTCVSIERGQNIHKQKEKYAIARTVTQCFISFSLRLRIAETCKPGIDT